MDNISKHKFFTPIELKAVVVGIVGEMALVYNQIMIKSFIIGIITSSLSLGAVALLGLVNKRNKKVSKENEVV
jgi:hypothetical protein